jgi:Flp pilus assembly protein TadD
MYLPLMALVVLGVIPFAQLAAHIVRTGRASVRAVSRTGVALWAAAATALAAGTRDRNQDYSSPLQLARIDFERWPVAYTRHALGDELLEAGERDEALVYLREAARDDPRAHFTYGKALFQAGRLPEARQELEEFVRVRGDLLEAGNAKLMIGYTLIAAGKLDAAGEQFQQVLQIRPDLFDAHLGLAEVRRAQQRYEDASVEYRAYFAAGGANPVAWNQFGTVLAQSGQFDAAIEAFQRAMLLDPKSSEPHRHLASILMAQGKIEATIDHAGRAVMLNPGDALSRELLGIALMAANRRDEAIHQFGEALRINPSDADVQERLRDALNGR